MVCFGNVLHCSDKRESIQRVFRKKVCRHRSIWIMSSWRSPEQSRIVKDFYFPGWPLARFGLFLLWIMASPPTWQNWGQKKNTHNRWWWLVFLFPQTRPKILPALGRRHNLKRSFKLQFARHSSWMRFRVPGCIQSQKNFHQIYIF